MKKMICIVCPVGCHLTADEDGTISGNKCKRGEVYGRVELTAPTRVLTSTVRTTHPTIPRLSVKSKEPIPKGMLFDVVKELDSILITKTMGIGEVILQNVLKTGIDIVATRDISFETEENED